MPDLIFVLILAGCLTVAYAIGYRGGRLDCPECGELDARVEELEVALEDIRVEAEHVQGDMDWIARRASAALSTPSEEHHAKS